MPMLSVVEDDEMLAVMRFSDLRATGKEVAILAYGEANLVGCSIRGHECNENVYGHPVVAYCYHATRAVRPALQPLGNGLKSPTEVLEDLRDPLVDAEFWRCGRPEGASASGFLVLDGTRDGFNPVTFENYPERAGFPASDVAKLPRY